MGTRVETETETREEEETKIEACNYANFPKRPLGIWPQNNKLHVRVSG